MNKCQPRALTPFLDGELGTDLWQEIDDHLQGCPSCGALFDELSLASRQVRTMGRAEIPDSALKPALEIFTDRAGLVPESAMLDTYEVARAAPTLALAAGAGAEGAGAETGAVAELDPGARLAQVEKAEANAEPAGVRDAGEEQDPQPVPETVAEAPPPTWIEAAWAPAGGQSSESPELEPETNEADIVNRAEALVQHPSPPPTEIPAPWAAAAGGEEEDLEEFGRRAVDEAMAPPTEPVPVDAAEEAVSEAAADASVPAEESELEPQLPLPEAATEGPWPQPREASHRPEAETLAWVTPLPPTTPDQTATPAADEVEAVEVQPVGIESSLVERSPMPTPDMEIREAMIGADAEPTTARGGLSSLRTQLGIGVIAATLLIVVAAAMLLGGRGLRQQTASTRASGTHASTPGTAASPAHSAAPSPAASAAAAPVLGAQLTDVVSAGAGGSGWRVLRVRIGSPSPTSGITRVVLDLDGTGPPPDARLGRGPDGAVYLTAPGISVSTSDLSGFTGTGAVTGLTQTGTSGLALRLATSGNPGFSIGYLGGPNRLVLDFK